MSMPRTTLARWAATACVATLAALTAPGIATAATPAGDQSARAGAPGAPVDCSLSTAKVTTTAAVDARRTAEFTAYGNSGGVDGLGWSGADSSYSVPVSGGRLAWIFSDTFLGPVAPDGSRPQSSPFINNSIVVEKNGRLQTVTGNDAGGPTGLVPPAADNSSWYWFGAGLADRSGHQLDVVALNFARTGTGIWDFAWAGNYLARLDTRTWQRTALVPLPSSAGIEWSAWLQRQGPDVLVYGVEDLGAEKYLHLAKVLGGDLARTDSWRYWATSGWSRAESESARILDHVANEMSVTPFRDGYLAVTQDTSVLFNTQIRGHVACSPHGPFTDIGVLYNMPETGLFGSYGDPNVFAYNAHEHPELRRGNTVYLTYNVNSFDNQSLYSNASIYRPRFVRVQLNITK
jgi:hypothetical protein